LTIGPFFAIYRIIEKIRCDLKAQRAKQGATPQPSVKIASQLPCQDSTQPNRHHARRQGFRPRTGNDCFH
jgi:hypothetical protein